MKLLTLLKLVGMIGTIVVSDTVFSDHQYGHPEFPGYIDPIWERARLSNYDQATEEAWVERILGQPVRFSKIYTRGFNLQWQWHPDCEGNSWACYVLDGAYEHDVFVIATEGLFGTKMTHFLLYNRVYEEYVYINLFEFGFRLVSWNYNSPLDSINKIRHVSFYKVDGPRPR